jgi:hypothetical protein
LPGPFGETAVPRNAAPGRQGVLPALIRAGAGPGNKSAFLIERTCSVLGIRGLSIEKKHNMIIKRLFDTFGIKKSGEQQNQEREMERAWALYGNEVDEFLKGNDGVFEGLEKSKYITRPKLEVAVIREEDAPLSIDLALRVKRGDLQASKAHRFMTDPELRKILALSGQTRLSEDLMLRVKQGDIQASKARRFMTDPELRKILG